MRQIAIITSLLFLLFFIIYFFTPDFSLKTKPELFVDEQVLLLVTQKDLEKRIDEFTLSPLGRVFAETDFQAIARELETSAIDAEKLASIKKNIQQTLGHPLVKILFGREVSVALSPFQPGATASFEQQILDNLLVIGRPKHPAKLIDMLTAIVPEEQMSSEALYGGHVIKRFPLDERQVISAARVDDLFVFSFNEKLLRRGLDRYDNGGAGSLAELPDFLDNKGRFGKASLFCYLNIFKLYQAASSTLNSIGTDKDSRLGTELEKFRGYRSGYFGAWKEKDKITEKAVIGFVPEEMTREVAKRITAAPGKADTVSRVTDDTLLYYWNSQLDLDPFLEIVNLLGGQGKGERNDDIVQHIASITGLQTDDIQTLAEKNVTLAVKSIPENQFVPIPSFMFSLQVPDTEKMRKAVDNLIDYYSIPVRKLQLQGVSTLTWGGVMAAGDLQPTLAFVDDYLVVSSNREQIKEFIKMPKGKKNLSQGTLYKSVDRALSEKNSSVVFLNFAKITGLFKELVSWGGTMIAIEDRDIASKSKLLIDRLINPILDGLAMYSVVGMRKYVEGDTIVFETTTIIHHGNK